MGNWKYWLPIVSWVYRPYHWIKGDEDDWTGIERNLMSATGNVWGAVIIMLAILVITIIE